MAQEKIYTYSGINIVMFESETTGKVNMFRLFGIKIDEPVFKAYSMAYRGAFNLSSLYTCLPSLRKDNDQ